MLKEDFEEILKEVKKKFPVMKINRVISTSEGTIKEAEVIVFRGKKSITLNIRNYNVLFKDIPVYINNLSEYFILAERYEKEIVMFYSDFKGLEFYIGKL